MTAPRLKGKKKGSTKPLTFTDMMQIGLGQLRLSPSAFYSMTVIEFVAAMRGAWDLEQRAYQQQWAQTRWLATLLLQPHSKRKLQPQDLQVFEWEQTERKRRGDNTEGINILKRISGNGTA